MKKVVIISTLLFHIITGSAQNVGIGTTTPNASAQLDVSSPNKGFLPPRMTMIQRDSIINPAAGLIIYCIDCTNFEMQFFNGTNWMNMTMGLATTNLPSVTICSQTWAIKNLNVDRYRNGDPIPKITVPIEWAALTTGAYCYYNNDSATYAATYGKLYNWYAMNDPRGLAPTGWHIPSNAEWTMLEACLGGQNNAGGAMKEMGTTHWTTPNTGAINYSGFTGLPGNFRSGMNGAFGGFFGNEGDWWSSTEYNSTFAWGSTLYYTGGSFIRNYDDKRNGFSVRCLRD